MALNEYAPAGVLRVLSSSGKTGAVRFGGKGGCTVYLYRGQLYFAEDDHTDEALVTALVRPGRISAEDWSQAMTDAGEQSLVGERLVREEAIDPTLLASVLLSVAYDPLIRLFREGGGAFDFEPGAVHWIGPFHPFDVDAIVQEVQCRVDEVDEMSTVVPATEAWVSARRALPENATQVTLLREDWELVASLTGPRTISELAVDMGRGRHSTARVVYRLAQAGLLDVVSEVSGPSSEAHGSVEDFAAFEDDFDTRTGSRPSGHAGNGNGNVDGDGDGDGDGWSLAHHQTVALKDSPEIAQQVDLPANAAWLENLYARFMDGTQQATLDVAFAVPAAEAPDARASTLRRLTEALRKI